MNAQGIAPTSPEISVACEVLVFEFGSNPKYIAQYSDKAIRTMIDRAYPGGIVQFRFDHAEAIADLA